MEPGRYVFCVDEDYSPAGNINMYYIDRGFTSLNSKIPKNASSLEQETADALIKSVLTPQNAAIDSFCSKNEEGVNEEYIVNEFIKDSKSINFRKILINTIIYFDSNNKPFAFLMYKNYPHDNNSIYISILCINSIESKDYYPAINGDLIVSNFKIACESVGIHNIYLESIPSAEKFWRSKGFKLVDPQPTSSSSSSSTSSSSSSRCSSSSCSRCSSRSSSRCSCCSKSYSSSSSSNKVKDKLFYFNLIPTEINAIGKKKKKRKMNKIKSKRKGLKEKRNKTKRKKNKILFFIFYRILDSNTFLYLFLSKEVRYTLVSFLCIIGFSQILVKY